MGYRGRLKGRLGGVTPPNPQYCLAQRMAFGAVPRREAALNACGAERLGGRSPLAPPLAGRRYGVQGGNPPAFSLPSLSPFSRITRTGAGVA